MDIRENIARVRENIDAAARESGRTGRDVLLIGASKMNGTAACREAIAAGIDALGENRVQEMQKKLSEHAYDGAPLHFIGHLQRNKVRQVVGYVDLIQSVGSEPLLREIEKDAAQKNLVQSVLLEVNIGAEPAKTGFAPSELFRAAELSLSLPHVRVRGLMVIPPADAARELTLHYFEEVRTLSVDIGEKLFHNVPMELSMGMSGDYQDAIRAGATMVRVGTAIFGARHYDTGGAQT